MYDSLFNMNIDQSLSKSLSKKLFYFGYYYFGCYVVVGPLIYRYNFYTYVLSNGWFGLTVYTYYGYIVLGRL